ncbi:2,3-bisphosphoglycerate-independent phosphoglycerate mutase [Candidatus Woesearchaeota archaeon]|nr:2,3-bisphosphoglycerate-independent phosphoglycerate mutase [Candidatus Woesearchaeota archaeon]
MRLALPIRPLVLVIRDGWGRRAGGEGNAVAAAQTPETDWLLGTFPTSTIKTAGEHVGFPRGFLGTSEAGHLNIGAGRLVKQEVRLMDDLIAAGKLYNHPKLLALARYCKAGKALHLMGLLQDAGVHAHSRHLYALLEFARRQKLPDVQVHVFTDGRDTHPRSAHRHVARLQRVLRRLHCGRIATVSGRYYAMDRDNRWERIRKAYDAMVRPGAAPRVEDALDYVKTCHRQGIGDEFILPAALGDYAGMRPGDAAVHFNYRQDRAIQLTMALTERNFSGFPAEQLKLHYLGLTRYYDSFKNYLLEPLSIPNSLGEVLSRAKLSQLRVAETEKFKHVTSFLNGKVEKAFPGEQRVLIPSSKVATYDLLPEMRTREVADVVEKALLRNRHDVIIVNFAAPDMVGHTGKFQAAVRAVEAVDAAVGRLCRLVLETPGAALVTSDHGNCEEMRGEMLTSHTRHPVDCALVSRYRDLGLAKQGILADIAPTMLELLRVTQPKEMTGKSLLRRAAGGA